MFLLVFFTPFSSSLLLFSGRSSRSYKVAGFTLLACVLIAGQAITTYFLLSQRSDIKALEEQNDNLHSEMTNGRPGEEEEHNHPRLGGMADARTFYTQDKLCFIITF